MRSRIVVLILAGTVLVESGYSAWPRHLGSLPYGLNRHDYFDGGNPEPAKVELGKFLYFDKILSGNQNISCATCHHTLTGTGDGLALPVGEGGRGLGIVRDTGEGSDAIRERVPRNAPPVYNLGLNEFTTLFHDGRLSADDNHPAGFQSPAGPDLPHGLDNALAAQAMFPVTSSAEMAGQAGENPIAKAAAAGDLAGPNGVWNQLAERLRGIDEYVELFKAAYNEINDASDISYVHAANAIAAYEAAAFRAANSPFDRFLRGDRHAMSKAALRGMRVFYGRGRCASCHAGIMMTDLAFHSIALPPIGPGKGDGASGLDDHGRERVSADPNDRYRFRTPPLRNVALTGPWGHNGAYNDLRSMVEHHLNPIDALLHYDPSQAALPTRSDLDEHDFALLQDEVVIADIAASNDLPRIELRRRQVDDLMTFLHALTDPASLDSRAKTPHRVPSGLPLAD